MGYPNTGGVNGTNAYGGVHNNGDFDAAAEAARKALEEARKAAEEAARKAEAARQAAEAAAASKSAADAAKAAQALLDARQAAAAAATAAAQAQQAVAAAGSAAVQEGETTAVSTLQEKADAQVAAVQELQTQLATTATNVAAAVSGVDYSALAGGNVAGLTPDQINALNAVSTTDPVMYGVAMNTGVTLVDGTQTSNGYGFSTQEFSYPPPAGSPMAANPYFQSLVGSVTNAGMDPADGTWTVSTTTDQNGDMNYFVRYTPNDPNGHMLESNWVRPGAPGGIPEGTAVPTVEDLQAAAESGTALLTEEKVAEAQAMFQAAQEAQAALASNPKYEGYNVVSPGQVAGDTYAFQVTDPEGGASPYAVIVTPDADPKIVSTGEAAQIMAVAAQNAEAVPEPGAEVDPALMTEAASAAQSYLAGDEDFEGCNIVTPGQVAGDTYAFQVTNPDGTLNPNVVIVAGDQDPIAVSAEEAAKVMTAAASAATDVPLTPAEIAQQINDLTAEYNNLQTQWNAATGDGPRTAIEEKQLKIEEQLAGLQQQAEQALADAKKTLGNYQSAGTQIPAQVVAEQQALVQSLEAGVDALHAIVDPSPAQIVQQAQQLTTEINTLTATLAEMPPASSEKRTQLETQLAEKKAELAALGPAAQRALESVQTELATMKKEDEQPAWTTAEAVAARQQKEADLAALATQLEQVVSGIEEASSTERSAGEILGDITRLEAEVATLQTAAEAATDKYLKLKSEFGSSTDPNYVALVANAQNAASEAQAKVKEAQAELLGVLVERKAQLESLQATADGPVRSRIHDALADVNLQIQKLETAIAQPLETPPVVLPDGSPGERKPFALNPSATLPVATSLQPPPATMTDEQFIDQATRNMIARAGMGVGLTAEEAAKVAEAIQTGQGVTDIPADVYRAIAAKIEQTAQGTQSNSDVDQWIGFDVPESVGDAAFDEAAAVIAEQLSIAATTASVPQP